MFADKDPNDFFVSERVLGDLSNGENRGKYGNGDKFTRWISTNGVEQPAFTNVGRWKLKQEGSYNVPVFIPWWTVDLDGDDMVDVHEDAQQLLEVLDVLGYDLRRTFVSFSGRKGFHVQVSSWQFGGPVFQSSTAAKNCLKAWSEDVCDGVKWDPSVTSPQALLRVAGSRHESTGAVKRPWYASNFIHMSLERVFCNPREYKNVDFYDSDRSIVKGAREHLVNIVPKAKHYLKKERKEEGKEDGDGIIGRIKPGLIEGQEFGEKHFHVGRENGAYILACWFLERYSTKFAWEKLKHWNQRNDPPLPRRRLQVQFRGAKRTIYDGT